MFDDRWSRGGARHTHRPRRKFSPAEHAFVLGGLGLAAAATAVALVLGQGLGFLGPLCMAAIAWTVLAQIAHALWRGFRHRDWSCFGAYVPPVDRDSFDWSTRTGTYAYLRIAEEHERLMGDDS